MDALNLAIVICPNLVKGSNPARDVAMVCVPGTPALFDRPSSEDGNGDGKNPQGGRPATLGMVVALCIRRYYEVFDEVLDPSETVPAWHSLHNGNAPSSSAPGSPEQPMYVLSNEGEEEDDLDDDRLQKGGTPPASYNPVSFSTVSPPKRHKSTPSSGSNSGLNSTTRAMHTLIGETNESIQTSGSSNGNVPYSTYSKAKSTINVENGGVPDNGSRTGRGSITIGRGTMRKGSGAEVEAIGASVGGFFSPPADAPLVPDGKGGWKKS